MKQTDNNVNLLEKVQQEHAVWAYENFGQPQGLTVEAFHALDGDSFEGIVEEVGELAHARLKRRQRIRVGEDHDTKEKDALGDIMIYILDYCTRRGWDASVILEDTWVNVVRKRNWRANPATGETQGDNK